MKCFIFPVSTVMLLRKVVFADLYISPMHYQKQAV